MKCVTLTAAMISFVTSIPAHGVERASRVCANLLQQAAGYRMFIDEHGRHVVQLKSDSDRLSTQDALATAMEQNIPGWAMIAKELPRLSQLKWETDGQGGFVSYQPPGFSRTDPFILRINRDGFFEVEGRWHLLGAAAPLWLGRFVELLETHGASARVSATAGYVFFYRIDLTRSGPRRAVESFLGFTETRVPTSASRL